MQKLIFSLFIALFSLGLQAQVDLKKTTHERRSIEVDLFNKAVDNYLINQDISDAKRSIKKGILNITSDNANMNRNIAISLDPEKRANKYGLRQAHVEENIKTDSDYTLPVFTALQAQKYNSNVNEMEAIKSWLKQIKYALNNEDQEHIENVKKFRDLANDCFQIEDKAFQKAING
jgi:hypothetical protein